MKRSLILLSTILVFALAAFAPHANADSGAWCTADPSSGAIGTNFVIACGGFDANTWVYPY